MIDEDEDVVVAVATEGVRTGATGERIAPRPAGEGVVLGAAAKDIGPGAPLERVVAGVAEGDVGVGAPLEEVVSGVPLEPIESVPGAEERVGAIVAEEGVPLETAGEEVVAAAAAEPIVAADAPHVRREIGAVVAVEAVLLFAAPTVDEVVTVAEIDRAGLIAERHVDRAAAGDVHGEVGRSRGRGDRRPADREPARGEVGEPRDRAEPRHGLGRGERELEQALVAAESHKRRAREPLQTDQRRPDLVVEETADDRRVGAADARIDAEEHLIPWRDRIEARRHPRQRDRVDLPRADDGDVADRIPRAAIGSQKRAEIAPDARRDREAKEPAVGADPEERVAVERVEGDEHRSPRHDAERRELPRRRIEPPQPGDAGRDSVLSIDGSSGDVGDLARRHGDIADRDSVDHEARSGRWHDRIDRGEHPLSGGNSEAEGPELVGDRSPALAHLDPRPGNDLADGVLTWGHRSEAEGAALVTGDRSVAIEIDIAARRRGHDAAVGGDELHPLPREWRTEAAGEQLAHRPLNDPRGGLDDLRSGGCRSHRGADHELEHEVASARAVAGGIAIAPRRQRGRIRPLAVEPVAADRGHRVVVEHDPVAAGGEHGRAERLDERVLEPIGLCRGAEIGKRDHGAVLAVGGHGMERRPGSELPEPDAGADFEGDPREGDGRGDRVCLGGAVGYR